jgi:hypothetical protein
VSHKFSEKLLTCKVPHKLLEIACHDTQLSVQESALNVLKTLCKHEKAKKTLKDIDAIEKLSNITFLSPSNTDLTSSNNNMTASLICRSIIYQLKL